MKPANAGIASVLRDQTRVATAVARAKRSYDPPTADRNRSADDGARVGEPPRGESAWVIGTIYVVVGAVLIVGLVMWLYTRLTGH
jgi:hypothetical protein